MSDHISNSDNTIGQDGAVLSAAAANEAAAVAEEAHSEPETQPADPGPSEMKEPKSEPETQTAVSARPEKKEPEKVKKSGKAGKVILIILAVLLLLVLLILGAAFYTFRAMLTDDMPHVSATDSVSGTDLDVEALLTSSSKEILFENTMTLDPSLFNSLLENVRQTVNDSADSFNVEDLFCEFGDSKGSVYTRVHVDTVPVNGRAVKVDRTMPIGLDFDVDFDDPCVVLTPSKLKCGTVDIPNGIVKKLLESIPMADNSAGDGGGSLLDGNAARIEDGKVYLELDTAGLCSYASTITDDEAYEMLKDDEIIEEYRRHVGDDSIIGLVEDSTDIKISDIGIAGGKLVIYSDVSMIFNRVHEGPEENVVAGDYFYLGSYPQTADGQPEPIKWFVLDVRDGKALAISQMLLERKDYNDTLANVTWSSCTLRKWLNNSFYNTAFSDDDKSRIQTVKNVNPDGAANWFNHYTGAKGGPDTEDKVFCLSAEEANNYITSIDMTAAVTDYAKSQGADYSDKYTVDGANAGYWWLRSPGKNNKTAAYVAIYGDVHTDVGLNVKLHKAVGVGNLFVVDDVCVRPVIEVSLSE